MEITHCNSIAQAESCGWFGVSSPLSGVLWDSTEELRIASPGTKDVGIYRCTANNEMGSDSETTQVLLAGESYTFTHTQSILTQTCHVCYGYLTFFFSFIWTEHPVIMASWKNISDLHSANLKIVVGGRIRAHIGANLTLNCPVTGQCNCNKPIPCTRWWSCWYLIIHGQIYLTQNI